MKENNNVLIGVVAVLVILVGFLVYERMQAPDTLGESLSNSVQEIGEEIGDEIDDNTDAR